MTETLTITVVPPDGHDGDQAAAHAPGSRLVVRLTWDLDDCTAIAVRLCRAVHAGPRRLVQVVAERRVERPAQRGAVTLEFDLPTGPWSAVGRLGRLEWLVEAVALPRQLPARAGFVLAPSPDAVDLTGGQAGLRGLTDIAPPRV